MVAAFGRLFLCPGAGAVLIVERGGRVNLENSQSIIKTVIAAIGTVATYLWGGWDTVISALVVMVVFDYITGVVASAVHGRLDSAVGRRGIARKVGIFILVAIANILDRTGGLGEPILRTVVAWFYIGSEAISITENLAEIGVPIPARMRDALARLRDGGER